MNETFNPEFLNECLEAYIRTFTVKERLQNFIQKNGKEEIFTVIDEMLETATGYLYDYDSTKRIEWNDEFESKHYEFIRQKHEWLSPKGYKRIKAYGSWLSWHDGL